MNRIILRPASHANSNSGQSRLHVCYNFMFFVLIHTPDVAEIGTEIILVDKDSRWQNFIHIPIDMSNLGTAQY